MAEKSNKNINFKGNKKPSKKKKVSFYWIYGGITLVLLGIMFFGNGDSLETLSKYKLKDPMIKEKQIEKIVIVNDKFAEIYIKEEIILEDTAYKDFRTNMWRKGVNLGPHYKYEFYTLEGFQETIGNSVNEFIAKDTVGKQLLQRNEIIKSYEIPIKKEERKNFFGDFFSIIIFMVILFIFWGFMMRRMGGGSGGGGQLFNIGKSKAQLFDKNNTVNVTFKQVAGLAEAKVEVMEIVDFLKNPKKYTELGGKIPKGALLVGPPGTGKTLLAKAVAGEAKVPFFSLSGSDFVEMFVGVGASRVRDLFKTAKEKAPCIIFIDEIDAIGRARGKSNFGGGNDERENTLNQLLTEMDGFATNAGVIILAATNRAEILDRALLRAGRFDRQIHVELPDIQERGEIFQVHLKAIKIEKNLNVDLLAKQTPGFSGADIANVCNEAALIAARSNKKEVDNQDFMDAIDRIIGGLEKRNKLITPSEKRTIAYHEAGHATVSWLLPNAHPLVKVTIIPRGKALGAAWYLPEERQITTYEQLLDEVTATLGGRAAEEVMFDTISTGALNDLEKVTKQAYAIVAYYGLNKKIGNLSFYDSSGQSEYNFNKPFSEKTAEMIDSEISKLVEECYLKAKKILTDNKEKLVQLAEFLLHKEVIMSDDVEHIFGPRQKTELQLLDEKEKKEQEQKKLALASDNAIQEKELVAEEEVAIQEEAAIQDEPEQAKEETKEKE